MYIKVDLPKDATKSEAEWLARKIRRLALEHDGVLVSLQGVPEDAPTPAG